VISEAIDIVIDGANLNHDQAMQVMEEMMTGAASEIQMATLLTALRYKGESDKEILGFAEVMRSKSTKVTPKSTGLIDTCGTGGDKSGTFNISTSAAIVVAAAGAKVAKHGNRSVSSKCGSADVLEGLGVNIDLEPQDVADCIDEVGVGFLFAQRHHGAMKHVAPVRKAMGIRTVFNILGPLTNPASAEFQLLGVYDEELCAPMARVLKQLGVTRAMVVHGKGGLDEVSLEGPTIYAELRDGKVKMNKFLPEDFGFPAIKREDIMGGSIDDNVDIVRAVVDPGFENMKSQVVYANAGTALYVAGIADNIMDGAEKARAAVLDGRAKQVLDDLVDFTQSRAK